MMDVLESIMRGNTDPLSNLHLQSREARHNALMGSLHSALMNVYALARADFVWTFRRAMLLLSGRKDKTAARAIWALKNAYEMKNYWDNHIACGARIPKFKDLIGHWFCQNGDSRLSIRWTVEVGDSLGVNAVESGNRKDQWYLDNTPMVIKAADILAVFVKQTTNLNVHSGHKDFMYLEAPPEEQNIVAGTDSL